MAPKQSGDGLWKFLVSLPGKPECSDRLWELLMDLFAQIQQEPDFLHAEFFESIEQPGTIVIHETWKGTLESLEAQRLQSYRAAYEAELPNLLSSPRHILAPKHALAAATRAPGR